MKLIFEALIEELVSDFKGINLKDLKVAHGTTVIGMRYKDGVVVGGDMRMVMGYTIASESFPKVYPIDKETVIAISGTTGLAMELVEIFRDEVSYFERIHERGLSFEGKANILAKILRKIFPLVSQGLIVIPILATRTRILGFDILGVKVEKDLVASGSGSPYALGYLTEHFKKDLSQGEAVHLMREALKVAHKHDLATGEGRTIYVIENEVKKIEELPGGKND